MESITITRPVLVKVKVTEEYKKALAAEVQETVNRLDLRLQHMDFQTRRLLAELEKNNSGEIPAARQRSQTERQKILEARQKLVEKLKEIGKLVPGEEVIHGQVESIVEVKAGDDWGRLMGVEIIIENDRVVAIRERQHAAGERKEGHDHDR
ncbi:MAG: YlqD family protein [Bacillota bacterium]